MLSPSVLGATRNHTMPWHVIRDLPHSVLVYRGVRACSRHHLRVLDLHECERAARALRLEFEAMPREFAGQGGRLCGADLSVRCSNLCTPPTANCCRVGWSRVVYAWLALARWSARKRVINHGACPTLRAEELTWLRDGAIVAMTIA